MQATRPLTIALDAMGGDKAPDAVVMGALLALPSLGGARLVFFGDERRIKPLVDAHINLKSVSTIIHTDKAVSNDDKPTAVLRGGAGTSMWIAIESVAKGETDCIVSSGNTGALMVLARKHLKMLRGIDRPAIAAPMPTINGRTVVLDLGANAECTAENLVQFALMGAVYAKAALNAPNPTIGLVNVGKEDQKGTELVKKAAALLRDAHLPGKYVGYIEGNDIGKGRVDVAVTDGFTGNVLLKTAEGTAHFIGKTIKNMARESVLKMLCLALATPLLLLLRGRIDPRNFNGAMFVGLGGICVKSHGGTDEKGFANAIKVAASLVTNRFNETVAREIDALAHHTHSPTPETVT
jgi:glycerol-3-phosphate acyltransferase PlsX